MRIAPSGLALPVPAMSGARAVHGLVEIDCAADGGGGQHAERAGDDAGLVGEDVAEEVLGEDDVEVARDVHDVHRHGVNELMFERDVRDSPWRLR